MTPEEKASTSRRRTRRRCGRRASSSTTATWVTPEEKDALEKGLVKDGDDWVTEEEFHRRRGEKKVDGQWVSVGEAEGKAYADGRAAPPRASTLEYLWSAALRRAARRDRRRTRRRCADGRRGDVRRWSAALLRPTADDLAETRRRAHPDRAASRRRPPTRASRSGSTRQRRRREVVPELGAHGPEAARVLVDAPRARWSRVYQFPNTDKTLVEQRAPQRRADPAHALPLQLPVPLAVAAARASPTGSRWRSSGTPSRSRSGARAAHRRRAATAAPAPAWADSAKWRTAPRRRSSPRGGTRRSSAWPR